MAATLPVLTFHAIDDLPSVIAFPAALFRQGMARIQRAGYRAISLLDVAQCLRARAPFPDRSLVLTFDDGYQSVYEQGFPILQRLGLRATVFLTVGERPPSSPVERLPSLSGRSMLSWSEIREMQRWGIEFGAHTLTHPDLTRLPSERLEHEVLRSQEIVEDELGVPVPCFAYPFGRANRASRQVARRHFTLACTDQLGLLSARSDPYLLARLDAFYLRSARAFDLLLGPALPAYVLARSIPRTIRRALVSA
jgi:peptidoglycan/xylan/chitin deacetylase (PgdA/CDA1 family)